MQQKREVHRKTCLYQETRKTSNNQPNITPQGDRKRTTKLKVCRRKKVIKIRAEIKLSQKYRKDNEIKSWFFEKMNKINKPLSRLMKMKRERKIRNETYVVTDATEIKRIRDCYKQLYANKFNKLEETYTTYQD